MSASLQSGRRTTSAPSVHGRRGLPGPAAALLALVIAGLGAAVDVFTGPGLRLLFAICLVGGCLLAVLLVRRRDVLWLVFAPPLICLALALVSVLTTSHSAVGLTADYLTHGFPPIALATVLCGIVAAVRAIAGRQRRAPQHPVRAPERSPRAGERPAQRSDRQQWSQQQRPGGTTRR